MHARRGSRRALSGIVALGAFFASLGPSWAECPDFPKVSWWGGLSHERVIRYVQKRHNGNWDLYIAKWERQAAKLENALKRNLTVIVRKEGLRLKGEALRRYIERVKERVSVNRCLAREIKAVGHPGAAG